jgi:DNA primase large subunit
VPGSDDRCRNDSNADDSVVKDAIRAMTRQHKIAVEAKINKDGVASILTPEEKREYKLNDNISHFICRLAYCRNEELRKWFLTQEARLFNIRLGEVSPKTVKQLLESKCGIAYEEVREQDDDWRRFSAQITFRSGPAPPSDFVRVPFKEAISLVGRRAVFLLNGVAFVPIKEL